jgi:hypothetical protein
MSTYRLLYQFFSSSERLLQPVDHANWTARLYYCGHKYCHDCFIFSFNFVSLRLQKEWRGSSGG